WPPCPKARSPTAAVRRSRFRSGRDCAMPPGVCPSEDVLGRYATGALSEEDAQAIDTHVGQCTACLGRLGGLAADTDPVVAAPRRPRESDADCAELAQAVAAVLSDSDPATPSGSGAVLNGYRILGELGRGGMGQVYRAAHPRLEQEVALKVLRPGLESAPIL